MNPEPEHYSLFITKVLANLILDIPIDCIPIKKVCISSYLNELPGSF